MNKSRQVDKKITFQVRLDRGWRKILNKLKADEDRSIKALVEDALSNTYAINIDGKPYRKDD